MQVYFQVFLKYQNLLNELVKRDIKIRYRRSVLGVIWSVLNPLLLMIVMNMVFSTLFRFDIDNYIIYLLTGQVFFNFLSESSNRSMSCLIENAPLIRKVYIPKYIFPLSRVLSSSTNLGFSLIAVLIMMVISRENFTWHLLWLPFSLFYIFTFSLGVGLFFATYAVFFRDLIHIHGVLMTAWMYLTPIFYPESIIPEKYLFILDWNPMYYFIKYFRMIIMDERTPSLELNLICLGIALFSLIIGLISFVRNRNKFVLYT